MVVSSKTRAQRPVVTSMEAAGPTKVGGMSAGSTNAGSGVARRRDGEISASPRARPHWRGGGALQARRRPTTLTSAVLGDQVLQVAAAPEAGGGEGAGGQAREEARAVRVGVGAELRADRRWRLTQNDPADARAARHAHGRANAGRGQVASAPSPPRCARRTYRRAPATARRSEHSPWSGAPAWPAACTPRTSRWSWWSRSPSGRPRPRSGPARLR